MAWLSTRNAILWIGPTSSAKPGKVNINAMPTTYVAAWISAAMPPIFCRVRIISASRRANVGGQRRAKRVRCNDELGGSGDEAEAICQVNPHPRWLVEHP